MSFPILPLVSCLKKPGFEQLTGNVITEFNNQGKLNKIKTFVKENFSKFDNINVLVNLPIANININDLIDLLDAGVSKLFVEKSILKSLLESGVNSSRLILKINSQDVNENKDKDKNGNINLSSFASFDSDFSLGLCFILNDNQLANKESLLNQIKESFDLLLKSNTISNSYRPLYITIPDSSLSNELVNQLVKHDSIPLIHVDLLSLDELDSTNTSNKISLPNTFISSCITDRQDGLFTTIVTDIYDRALGVVYSSAKSIVESFKTSTGVYQSRKRGLWYKGATSGATQSLLKISKDCDGDAIKFTVIQNGVGFCHLESLSCFDPNNTKGGVLSLETLLQDRLKTAPEGSYTKRLFNDEKLLAAKILEEAEELTEAKSKDEISWEAADLLYFALTHAVKHGVTWKNIQDNLDMKSRKITRRKGDAKRKWEAHVNGDAKKEETQPSKNPKLDDKKTELSSSSESIIKMPVYSTADLSESQIAKVLERPVQKTKDIMKLVQPIIDKVRSEGDAAILEFTAKFEHAQLESPILTAPYKPEHMNIDEETKASIDLSFENIKKFHAAQINSDSLKIETVPGVICSRFSRPIERVGLYIPGGTAVLPSTALMLGVPALVAGCKDIIFASPPRADGSISPEIVYIAHKVGAKGIVLAGGAQAVAALAYGTKSVPKVDKIFGPGNQFVTAAKMYVANDTTAKVAIDMPAGPSEVLVIADETANGAFVASDLLSQAEHGVDSQVILISINLSEEKQKEIDQELNKQALALPRVDIVRGSIAHSVTLSVKSVEEAFKLSNLYAPEHLILHIKNSSEKIPLVDNAGSVFVGSWSPESCGDYSSGTNHTLPTYGYAKSYSGVNTASFLKFITSQELTQDGLKTIGSAVMRLAEIEGLDAHRNAVKVRLESL